MHCSADESISAKELNTFTLGKTNKDALASSDDDGSSVTLADGNAHKVRITYESKRKTLAVSIDGKAVFLNNGAAATATLTAAYDDGLTALEDMIGGYSAYVGFTASNGNCPLNVDGSPNTESSRYLPTFIL